VVEAVRETALEENVADLQKRDPDMDALDDALESEQLVLSDLINRVLDKGVVISSHITISIADIDLVAIDLKLLITSFATLAQRQARRGPQ
jgi:gas vesicle structural protein